MTDRSSLPGFVLVTGNRNKVEEAEKILGFRPEQVDIDLPEIQELDLQQVLVAKAEEAWRRLERPLVVEDTGLELGGMNGFPGPLVKWMLGAIGVVGLAQHAVALRDPSAVARTGLLYRDGEQEIYAEGLTRGRLVSEPRGDQGFGWDPVFQPEGTERTYAEMSVSEKSRFGHRGRAWRSLLAELENLSNVKA